jgi:glycosyltransferase involved in cell wall biosynthesis
MKILILADGIFPFVVGGMQRHSANLAKFMTLRGHEVTLVHGVSHKGNLPTEREVREALSLENAANFKSISLRFPAPGFMPGHYLKESYLFSIQVYNKVKDDLNSFDFVYAKGFCAWHMLSLKRKGRQMPPIGVKFHGYEMFQPPVSLKARLQHLLLQGPVKWNTLNADFVFSYGAKITGIVKKLGVAQSKILEVPTGIDQKWFCASVKEVERPVKFLFLGRFERRKGVEELNEALTNLRDVTGFEFHFIGPIPASKKLKMPQVTYHGQITDMLEMQRIMDVCDVLVVPSHSEGMPNVILEGMSRGLAVLATDVGAVSVQVDEQSGWLIAPSNVKMLEDQLRKVISAEVELITLKKKAARAKVEHQFAWSHIAEIIDEKLSQIL